MERSGQGLNDIFEDTIRRGKGKPSIKEVDGMYVTLFIPAQVKDPAFIAYLKQIVNEKQIHFSFEEILALEEIREAGLVSKTEFRDKFLELGIIEKVGRGRGMKYCLSHDYYAEADMRGTHTKLVGLSREQKKELILNHIKKNDRGIVQEFSDAMPELPQKDIENILQEMKRSGLIEFKGSSKAGAWFLAESN